MRSASSTWAGRPVDMRPATYLTSGENASTSCSRARGSPVSLYRRQSSLSSIALTFVSPIAIASPCLGPRMGLGIHPPKAPRLYPSVGLRRAYARVPEELLDGAQIGSALEQVGGERVPERVRRDTRSSRRPPRGEPQPAPDVGGGEPAAATGEEQRRLDPPVRTAPLLGRESRPALRQVGVDRAPGGLPGGHGPPPPPLSP